MTHHAQRAAFDRVQTAQLLKPIHPNRILHANNQSHVSQQDITAHLIRCFGFGNFDLEVVNVECVFEHPRLTGDETRPTHATKWDVCYRAVVRLTIRNRDGQLVAVYEDGSTHTAENSKRGSAHDLAYKSAISLSKKRCAINLGDQFGLSLYNKGQKDALVRGVLKREHEVYDEDGNLREQAPAVEGKGDGAPVGDVDVQDGVPQQVALGNDETSWEDDGTEPEGAGRARAQAALSRGTGSEEPRMTHEEVSGR